MSKQIFITGTNTEVGKTHIGLELLKSLSLKYNCIAYKPIETGCRSKNNKLIPSDSQKYEKLIGDKVSLEKINPYRFIPPVSPYKAIKDAKKKIYIKNYCEKIKNLPKAEIILIEGAGGAFSPLATDGLNIDLMKALKSINILYKGEETRDASGATDETFLDPLDISSYSNQTYNLYIIRTKPFK